VRAAHDGRSAGLRLEAGYLGSYGYESQERHRSVEGSATHAHEVRPAPLPPEAYVVPQIPKAPRVPKDLAAALVAMERGRRP